MQIAETLRTKVLSWSGDENACTVSIGVACTVPNATTAWTDLVNAADKALYAAKAAGRNRCMLAASPTLSLVA
jgi:diguanylate cyclase (GGDEF)-like protein